MLNKDIVQLKGKKGGSSQKPPTDDPNTLQSKATARIIDLLCEGEIEGLVNGKESIYIDNVPVKSYDALLNPVYNWEGVEYEFRPGSPDGQPLNDYPDAESEINVGIQLLKNIPITRTISAEVDEINIKFTFPSLVRYKSSGKATETSVQIRIEIRPHDYPIWSTVADITKTGKTLSNYQCSHRIKELERLYGTGPWYLRCTRLTDDSDTQKKQNNSYWSSYTEVINRQVIYSDSAVIGLTLDAQKFGSRIPERSFDCYGKRVNIPSNYNPITRTYTGTWDGTFVKAYTNNPTWCWLDMVTTDRYGLGLESDYYDIWELYTVSQYCDGLVNDGFGGTEPRYTLNFYIQSREDAVHLLNLMAGVFRASSYWSGEELILTQDYPKTSVKNISPSNVIDGMFEYKFTPKEHKYTVCNVCWNDPDDDYKVHTECVEDNDGKKRYGYKDIEVVAVGCTSRGQAYRFGKWFLYTSLYEYKSITYRTSWDNADVLPGEIVTVYDAHEADVRLSGRIDSITSNTITLDQGITLEVGVSYIINCITADGERIQRTITTSSDGLEHTTLDVNEVWPVGNYPQVNSVWGITATNVYPEEYRIVSIEEVEDNIFEFKGLIYDSDRYEQVEDDKTFPPEPISKVPNANEPIEPPTNIQAEPYTYEDTDEISSHADRKTGVLLSWEHTRDTRFQTYEVQWRRSDESFGGRKYVQTTDNSYDIRPVNTGTYTFRVRAKGMVKESIWLTLSEVEIDATPGKPPDVENLRVINGDDDTTFTGKDCEIAWDEVSTSIDSTAIAVYDGTAPTSYAPVNAQVTKVKDYQVEILTHADVHIRYEYVTDNNFKYLFNMNQLDNGTPIRDLKFKVWARDIFYQLSDNPAVLIATNPAPDMSSTTPNVTQKFAYLKTEWTPNSDTDTSHYIIYSDENNPPTTEVGKVIHPNDGFEIHGLSAGTEYFVQIEPYDEFGIGVKSVVASGIPLEIPDINVDTELQNTVEITQCDTSAFIGDLTTLYDDKFTTGGVTSSNPYGCYLKYEYKIKNYINRMTIWSSNSNAQVYIGLSTDDVDYTYFKCASGHEPDVDGYLTQATDSTDAESGYWQLSEGRNISLLPFNNTAFFVRLYFVNSNSTGIYEALPFRILIGELAAVGQLSAISADIGTIIAGNLQSADYSPTEGINFDLDDKLFYIRHAGDDKLIYDGSTGDLSIAGTVNLYSGSYIGSLPTDNVEGWAHASDHTKIDGGDIYANSVTANQIAANTITATQIASNTITASEIAANSINASELNANCVYATHVGTHEIIAYAANIKNAVITGAKIGVAEIDTLRVAGNAITVPVGVYTLGPINFPVGCSTQTVQSLTFNPEGGSVILLVGCWSSSTWTWGSPTFYLYKNGVMKLSSTLSSNTSYLTISYFDNTGDTSNVTWQLRVNGCGGYVNRRSISAISAKR